MKAVQFPNLRPKSPQESVTQMTQLVLSEHINSLNSLFGGVAMGWIDIAAAICAQRHSGRTCVTASIDELHFLRPIRLGYVVNILAQITAVHRTSCEVKVVVEGENGVTGERFKTATAYLTFVAIDQEGRPAPMPPLKLTKPEEKRAAKEADLRKAHRMKLKEALGKSRAD